MAYTIKKLPEGYEAQSGEQNQVQAGTQVGGYTVKSVPTANTSSNNQSIFSSNKAVKTAISTMASVGGLKALDLVGKGLDKLGRGVYGLTLNPTQAEAEAVQSYRAGTTSVKPVTATDTAYEAGIIGSKQRIGRVAERKANDIFKKTINPIMKQADDMGIKIKYSDLVKTAKESIKNSVKYSDTQKKTILENIDDLAKNYKGTTTLKNLDLEKQAIASKIPARYQNMAKVPNELKVAQKELAKSFRNGVHSTIQKNFNVNSAKLYNDYANLKNVSKIGPKAATQSAFKGGAGSFVTNATQQLITPATTTAGKAIGKTGKALQKPRQALTKAAKSLAKGTKNVGKAIGKGAGKIIKNGSVFAIVQDGTIIPGSPTNIAERARLTTAQYKKDENSVYQSANNPIGGTTTIWDKGEVDKAVRKANNGASEGQFVDQFGNLHLLKDGKIYDIY